MKGRIVRTGKYGILNALFFCRLKDHNVRTISHTILSSALSIRCNHIAALIRAYIPFCFAVGLRYRLYFVFVGTWDCLPRSLWVIVVLLYGVYSSVWCSGFIEFDSSPVRCLMTGFKFEYNIRYYRTPLMALGLFSLSVYTPPPSPPL